MTRNNIVERTADALLKVFGSHLDGTPEQKRALIGRHIFAGQDDPGGWAPSAAVVIHTEAIMLPVPAEVPAIEAWCRVTNELGDHFCEHINYAVAAVYPA